VQVTQRRTQHNRSRLEPPAQSALQHGPDQLAGQATAGSQFQPRPERARGAGALRHRTHAQGQREAAQAADPGIGAAGILAVLVQEGGAPQAQAHQQRRIQ
jgi:hypothetical protein